MIGIINYGSGNFASVYNALSLLTKQIVEITSAKDFNKCSHIILPGVGSFDNAISKLEKLNLLEGLDEHVIKRKIPFLGICVGMQILADFGFEFGKHKGLGYVGGVVDKLDIDLDNYCLPHMGWNNVSGMENSPLFKDIDPDATFYFVHSYYFKPKDEAQKVVTTFYGKEFTAAFSADNIHGVQFHPEKSQYYGLKLLKNFIAL
jgi:glutamine amidotransferase